MIKKSLSIIIDILVISALIGIMGNIVSAIYKDIKITSRIQEPSLCIKINDEYYCKVQEQQKLTKIIEA